MRETLSVPEKCSNCPIATELREQFHAAYVDAESELAQREVVIQFMEDAMLDSQLTEEEKATGRSNVFKATSGVLDNAEIQQNQIQSNANFMTGSCEGTMELQGKNVIGKDVTARVCGSPVWHGNTTEYAHIQRP